MSIVRIAVPDHNDSFSRVVLDGVQYLVRFTYSAEADRWSFGLYTMQKEPIAVGVRIVPNFPLNLQIVSADFPKGVFGAYSGNSFIGRDDFRNGRAEFAYIPEGGGA